MWSPAANGRRLETLGLGPKPQCCSLLRGRGRACSERVLAAPDSPAQTIDLVLGSAVRCGVSQARRVISGQAAVRGRQDRLSSGSGGRGLCRLVWKEASGRDALCSAFGWPSGGLGDVEVASRGSPLHSGPAGSLW